MHEVKIMIALQIGRLISGQLWLCPPPPWCCCPRNQARDATPRVICRIAARSTGQKREAAGGGGGEGE